MFFEPEPTQYDLHFRILGVPVRVHPFFWIFSAVLGWSTSEKNGLAGVVIWVGCVFFSVLLHELGHIAMGHLFGSRGHIVLFSFGGLAIPDRALVWRWQRILVSFAGPFAQLILLAMLTPIWLWHPLGNPRLQLSLDFLLEINLFWPILNLLPIWPLDGGRISMEVSEGISPRNGTSAALYISMATAGFLAVNAMLSSSGHGLFAFVPDGSIYWILIAFLPSGILSAMFFASMAVSNYQMLQTQKARRPWEDDLPWER